MTHPLSSEYRRLTTAMDLASLRGDEPAWSAALVARERLGIDLAREPELAEWRSEYRCRCCGRLEWTGVCEDAMGSAA